MWPLMTATLDLGLIGAFHVDDPQTGRASVRGAALQQWLAAVRAAPGPQPSQQRDRKSVV